VRIVDNGAIKAHADVRFRSEYDYALFEYYRSAKVIKFLDQAGVDAQQRRGPAEAFVERVGILAEGGLHRREEEIVGHGRRGRRLAHDRPLVHFDTILYRVAV
jgi:hypothetical protein